MVVRILCAGIAFGNLPEIMYGVATTVAGKTFIDQGAEKIIQCIHLVLLDEYNLSRNMDELSSLFGISFIMQMFHRYLHPLFNIEIKSPRTRN